MKMHANKGKETIKEMCSVFSLWQSYIHIYIYIIGEKGRRVEWKEGKRDGKKKGRKRWEVGKEGRSKGQNEGRREGRK